MITHAFTCSGAYSLLIMTGLKRVENRSAFPTPDKGRCAVSVSKKFCQDEYDNLMAWLKDKVSDEVYASMPTWDDVKGLSRANLNGVVWVMGLCEERAFGR